MDFTQWRNEMMITKQWSYLNHAAVGPLPNRTREALIEQVNFKAENGGGCSLDDSLNAWDKARKTYGELLGAPAEMIATPLSTAHAIAIALDAIQGDATKKRNIVVNEMEFTTNSFPYQVLAERYKLEIRVIASRRGELPLERFENAVNADTLVVGLSHVQFSNGYKADLAEISKIAHDNDAYFFVDAIQSMGTTPIRAREWGVDFLGGSGFKWLLGPYGAGIAYFNLDVFGEMKSIPAAGWWSAEYFQNMAHHLYDPARDARRFQSNIFPAMMALEQSVKLLLDVGVENIETKIHMLHDLIIKAFEDQKDVKFESPLDPSKRGGILLLRVKNPNAVVKELMNAKVRVSLRNGAIRVAPHGYNTKEEIQRFIEILKASLD